MIKRQIIAEEQMSRGAGEKVDSDSPLPLGPSAPLPLYQSGFTIIDSLIAVVVVAILMSAIAPMITLSVATRVQSRRVELATQAARAYVDGVRAEAISTPNHTVELDEVDNNNNFTFQRNIFAGVAAPTSSGSLTCTTSTPGYPYCPNSSTSSLYCIDLDGGGCNNTSLKDLLVQAFRSVIPSSTNADKGYLLGLRVYRADAFKEIGTLEKGTQQGTYTYKLGDRKVPLVEMTTEIFVTDKTTYRDFCDRVGGCQ